MTVPQAPPTDKQAEAKVRQIVANHRGERGALLPILHAVQDQFGAVTPEAIPLIADELNLSRADVHGVASFYRDFRSRPAGVTTVRICRAEACQAVGARDLVAAAQDHLGVMVGETAADGSVTLDEVFCLGNCALGPALQVNGTMHGKVTPDRLASVISEASVQ